MLHVLNRIFATTGFIFASILLLCAFFPPQIQSKQKLALGNIINCKETTLSTDIKLDNLDEKVLSEASYSLADSLPKEIIQGIAGNIHTIAERAGMNTEVNLSFCIFNQSDSKLKIIETYLKGQTATYTSGTPEEIIKKVDSFPFINFSNIKINAPLLVAKSNYCSNPIHKSNIYFFFFHSTSKQSSSSNDTYRIN